MFNDNAQASSSRVPSNPIKRERAGSKSTKDKGKERFDGNNKSPKPPSLVVSDSGKQGGSTARRVRTVPPSAIYEPPTPPSPVHSPLPHVESQTITSPNSIQRKKRRHRIRYSSSEDSSADSDDEDDSSDDEPPWWTFTQRGMAKLRAKNLHRNGRDIEQGSSSTPQNLDLTKSGKSGKGGNLTEGESGRESGKEREREFPFLSKERDRNRMSDYFTSTSRRSSKDKESISSNINTNLPPNKSTPSSSLKNFKRSSRESPSELSGNPKSLLHPAPIRFSNTHTNFFRRSVHRQDTLPDNSLVINQINMQRTNSAPIRPASAPTSPTIESAPSPGLTTLVDNISSRLPSNELSHENHQSKSSMEYSEPLAFRRLAKRQLTAPNFPKFFKDRRLLNGNDTDDDQPLESLTDTEVIPSASARTSRLKSSLSKPVAIPGIGNGITPSRGGSGTSTPNNGNISSQMIRSGTGESIQDQGGLSSTPTSRPKNKRRPSNMLKIQLPPPITNRFKDGWPHAGSWQDALYGYYEEENMDPSLIKPSRPSRSRRPTSQVKSNNNNNDTSEGGGDPKTPQKPEFITSGPSDDDQISPRQVIPNGTSGSKDGNVEKDGEGTKRTKSRRQKRYRQALVPPTPSGLGFTPSARTGSANEYPWSQNHNDPEKGFDWQNGLAQKEAQSQSNGGVAGPKFNGGDNLNRQETTATTTGTHSTSSLRRNSPVAVGEKGWWNSKKSERRKRKEIKKQRRRQVDSDWRKRYRRMLFLDARVTIWIRLMNLAVVVVSLGLAITIKLELEDLRLPGLIGSSTTLIISYSVLTILHVLTAIYREYFGKPIGLWGLRSKMLWVCLDLLFVAFWSSAMSLSINDLIATPLECTKGSAWWRKGLSTEYSELLNELKSLQQSSETNSTIDYNITKSIISSSVSHSISITLPSTIIDSPLAHEACRRQAGTIALSLLSLLLYGGNMVISLFRIFETVRRTANVSKAVTL